MTAPMASPIRAGILGTGWAAGRHAEALRRLPGVELAAVAGRDPAGAAAFAERHGVACARPSAAALLEDPSIDAVPVCTVNARPAEPARHAPAPGQPRLCEKPAGGARNALAGGKQGLCEKPVGVSAAETSDLVALAEEARGERGLVSGVCFNYRHYPVIEHVRRALERQDYGPAHFVHGAYLQDWLLLETDWSWRLEERAGGRSRAVADIGSHRAEPPPPPPGAARVEGPAPPTTPPHH